MSDRLHLEWPSKRIPPGGAFHNHRVEYTPETQAMIKVLMDESKLTLLQRKKVDWCLRTGECLNDLKFDERRRKSTSAKHGNPPRPRTSRRRSLSAIKVSGDFERERYRPHQPTEDRETVKERLQEIMEFGKNASTGSFDKTKSKMLENRTKVKSVLPTAKEMMLDLLSQIQERAEWLEDMEALGEGVKHKEAITDQIAERLKRIEILQASSGEAFDISDKASLKDSSKSILVHSQRNSIISDNDVKSPQIKAPLQCASSHTISSERKFIHDDRKSSSRSTCKSVSLQSQKKQLDKVAFTKRQESISDFSLSCRSYSPKARTEK